VTHPESARWVREALIRNATEVKKKAMNPANDYLHNLRLISNDNVYKAYAAAGFLAILYVASLYIWKNKEISTHPETIKRRFISVAFVTLFGPVWVGWFVDPYLLQGHSLAQLLGLRLDALIYAIVLPFILTYILFLGPISMEWYSGYFHTCLQPTYWFHSLKTMIGFRNYIIAPLTEEFIFRACILALIISCTEPTKAVFICPIFFGTAHLHHMIEQIRLGTKWRIAVFTSLFQFSYTYIFGAYSAYLFLRTGHVIAPIVCHSFCNHMGFPDFGALSEMPPKRRWISTSCFLVGMCGWIFLLKPMTQPDMFANNLPWSQHI